MLYDPDKLEWVLPILAGYLCTPIVITTIAGVVASLRYREAGHEVAGVVGFLVGIITVVGMVALLFFDTHNTELVEEYGLLFSQLAYAACCAVGVGVTVVLVNLTGRIRSRLTRRPDSDT